MAVPAGSRSVPRADGHVGPDRREREDNGKVRRQGGLNLSQPCKRCKAFARNDNAVLAEWKAAGDCPSLGVGIHRLPELVGLADQSGSAGEGNPA